MSDEISADNSSVGKVTGGIGIQNNYSQNIFKPLKIKDKLEFTVYKLAFFDFSTFAFAILIFIFSMMCIFAIFFIDFKTIFNFVNSIIYTYIICIFLYVAVFFIRRYRNKNRLILTKNSIALKERGNNVKNIAYDEIRSIVRKLTFLSYSIYIYKIDEVYPYIQFDIDSMHSANAIYELISNNIN